MFRFIACFWLNLLAGALANLGGLGVAFGPAGLAIGLVTSLGILGYQLHKSKNKKQDTDYFECSDLCMAPGGPDPKDPKDKKEDCSKACMYKDITKPGSQYSNTDTNLTTGLTHQSDKSPLKI